MARRTTRRGRGRDRGPNMPLLIAAGIMVVGAIGGTSWYLRSVSAEMATDDKTGCLTKRKAPEAVMFLVDTTDKLSAEHARRIRTHITDIVSQLPIYSKVLVVPFGGDIALPLEPVFDLCVPGKAGQERLDQGALLLQQRYEEFEAVIGKLERTLIEVSDAPSSPITNQVVRAVSDEVLHWDGEKRRLILVSDGLQSSKFRTPIGALPPPPRADFLKGVDAEYFEVGNQRGSAGQNRQLREGWQSWFENAGARVKIVAPGF